MRKLEEKHGLQCVRRIVKGHKFREETVPASTDQPQRTQYRARRVVELTFSTSRESAESGGGKSVKGESILCELLDASDFLDALQKHWGSDLGLEDPSEPAPFDERSLELAIAQRKLHELWDPAMEVVVGDRANLDSFNQALYDEVMTKVWDWEYEFAEDMSWTGGDNCMHTGIREKDEKRGGGGGGGGGSGGGGGGGGASPASRPKAKKGAKAVPMKEPQSIRISDGSKHNIMWQNNQHVPGKRPKPDFPDELTPENMAEVMSQIGEYGDDLETLKWIRGKLQSMQVPGELRGIWQQVMNSLEQAIQQAERNRYKPDPPRKRPVPPGDGRPIIRPPGPVPPPTWPPEPGRERLLTPGPQQGGHALTRTLRKNGVSVNVCDNYRNCPSCLGRLNAAGQ